MKTMFCKDCANYTLKATFTRGQSAGYCKAMPCQKGIGSYKVDGVTYTEVGRMISCCCGKFVEAAP